jgi:hypothetical protein
MDKRLEEDEEEKEEEEWSAMARVGGRLACVHVTRINAPAFAFNARGTVQKKNVNVNLESSPPFPLTISLYPRPVTVTHLAD